MRLRTFNAPDMKHAMKMIRDTQDLHADLIGRPDLGGHRHAFAAEVFGN